MNPEDIITKSATEMIEKCVLKLDFLAHQLYVGHKQYAQSLCAEVVGVGGHVCMFVSVIPRLSDLFG